MPILAAIVSPDIWSSPLGGIAIAVIGAAIWQATLWGRDLAKARWQAWRKPRTIAKRRERREQLTKELAVAIARHDDPNKLYRYILHQGIDITLHIVTLLATFFVIPILIHQSTLAFTPIGSIMELTSQVIGLLSIVASFLTVDRAKRALSVASNYTNYKKKTEEEIEKLRMQIAGGTLPASHTSIAP